MSPRALTAAVVAAAAAAAATAQNQVTNLPGAPALNFSQYAGYFTVDASHGRNLFYWFLESQGNPSTDPVVLWLNGGPGCSSLGGMWTENGPFIVEQDGATLTLNPWSWNKVANVLYLEAPAGVGFSFSNTPADYNTGDVQTAADNLAAAVAFFSTFPSFAGREFFIAGESYAGHYIPELAWNIIQWNAAGGGAGGKINLAGVLIGNGLTDEAIDFASNVPYFANHALVSWASYEAALAACGNGSLFAPCSGYMVAPPCPAACADALNTVNNEIGNINPYDILQDLCLTGGRHLRPDGSRIMGRGSGTVRGETAAYRMLKANPAFQGAIKARGGDDPFVPCIDEYVGTYLNRADVKAAIHANASITWVDCNQNTLNYTFNHSSMLPIYDAMAQAAPTTRVLVYSGDLDSVLPFLGTQWDMQALGRTVTSAWAPWTGSDGQPAGYVTALSHAANNDLRFLTVKGAGHMVPGTQPGRALDMLARFIAGQPF